MSTDLQATPPTRRERLRAQTLTEIKAAARRQLVQGSPHGIQLRAVARDVGLTAPALYRYYPSLEDLTDALTVDLFDELIAEMVAARDAAPADDGCERLMETSRAFRRYAVAHPNEFRTMFATPPGGFGALMTDECQAASGRFGSVFADQFRAVWQTNPFPVPGDDELAPGLAAGIAPYWSWLVDSFDSDMPKGAVVSFLQAWIRLYGTVALEVFGHLHWALDDAAPLFEQTLCDIGASWGFTPPLAAPA